MEGGIVYYPTADGRLLVIKSDGVYEWTEGWSKRGNLKHLHRVPQSRLQRLRRTLQALSPFREH